jgi:PST family polysaccharide transporter/lipopolysaccharide exporter
VSGGPGLSTKVARGVAWAAGGQAVIAIADLISILLVTVFWVSDKDFGIAMAVVPFYTALDYIADAGVTSALIQRDDHTPERVSTVFWFNMLVSSSLFVLLLGFGPLYAWFQHEPVMAWLLIAYGGKLLIQNLYAIPFALLRKDLRFDAIAKARIVAHVSESAARIVFAMLGATIWCFTLAAMTRAAVFAVIMQLRHPFLPKLVFRPREIVPYVKFGLRTAGSNVLYQLYTSLDTPIVFHFFGKSAAGIYALADLIVLEPVKSIANVVIDVAFPTFAKLRSEPKALAAQLVKFTRLTLMTVLPYAILIVLIVPDILKLFWLGHGRGDDKWTPDKVELCGQAARLLCVMGFFRALGLLGPPLLDGVGRPELTLRYMVVAAFAVPGSFLLGAKLLGPAMGFLSVAVAWAIGYPIAFAVLGYLVVRTINLPLREYVAGTWGIVATCAIGCGAGFAIDDVLPPVSDAFHLVAVGGCALLAIVILLITWQNITPRSIAAAMREPDE